MSTRTASRPSRLRRSSGTRLRLAGRRPRFNPGLAEPILFPIVIHRAIHPERFENLMKNKPRIHVRIPLNGIESPSKASKHLPNPPPYCYPHSSKVSGTSCLTSESRKGADAHLTEKGLPDWEARGGSTG